MAFESTAAADPAYQVWDLVDATPLVTLDESADPDIVIRDSGVVDVEFYRDIRPILQDHCVQCHTQSDPTPPGDLVLDDLTLYPGASFTGQQLPGDYARLCFDSDASWGYPPVISNGIWRQTNASRYVRLFQSRRSLLVWKVFGGRLDGWTNADHPTESVFGDANTLPAGADPNEADIDYTGDIMPPPGSSVDPLTIDEKMTFARWVDLGCPINEGQGSASEDYGWFLDDLRPTVALSSPRGGLQNLPVIEIVFGLADAYTGVDMATLSVKATIPVAGRPAEAELADLAQQTGEGIYTIALAQPIDNAADALLTVSVADNQGNITRVERSFSVLTRQTFLPNLHASP